jgi:hypothetical protein
MLSEKKTPDGFESRLGFFLLHLLKKNVFILYNMIKFIDTVVKHPKRKYVLQERDLSKLI